MYCLFVQLSLRNLNHNVLDINRAKSFDLNPQKGSGPIHFKGYCLLQELNTQPGVVWLG